MKIFDNYSLLHHNTFGIDQRCDRLLVYSSGDEAVEAAHQIDAQKPLLIIGGGSNLLLTQDFHGLVVTPEHRFEVELLSQKPSDAAAGTAGDAASDGSSDCQELRCWAGTEFDEVVDYAVSHGLYGMENLSLIPGECGASAVQNIGAYGAEAQDIISRIEAVRISDGQKVVIDPKDCEYSYRQSRFKHEWKNRYLITYVTYRLSRTFRPRLDYGNIRKVLDAKGIDEQHLTASELRQVIIQIRREKLPDPAVTGNAGSFFMNPIVDEATFKSLEKRFPQMPHYVMPQADGTTAYKIPAGWMIDQCGWKGRSLGKAGVHDRQALVLVNRGGAKGEDVVKLMQAIQKDVKERFGLDLHPEVNVI